MSAVTGVSGISQSTPFCTVPAFTGVIAEDQPPPALTSIVASVPHVSDGDADKTNAARANEHEASDVCAVETSVMFCVW